MKEEALYEFLYEEKSSFRSRLELTVERMKSFHSAREQTSLNDWTTKSGEER
jgi:hypothetical protein